MAPIKQLPSINLHYSIAIWTMKQSVSAQFFILNKKKREKKQSIYIVYVQLVWGEESNKTFCLFSLGVSLSVFFSCTAHPRLVAPHPVVCPQRISEN